MPSTGNALPERPTSIRKRSVTKGVRTGYEASVSRPVPYYWQNSKGISRNFDMKRLVQNAFSEKDTDFLLTIESFLLTIELFCLQLCLGSSCLYFELFSGNSNFFAYNCASLLTMGKSV